MLDGFFAAVLRSMLCRAFVAAVFVCSTSAQAQTISVEPGQQEAADDPVAGDVPDESAQTAAELEQALLDELRLQVEHRTLGVREGESELYYRLLDRAARVDPQFQRAAASGTVQQRRALVPRYRDNPDLEFPVFVDLFKNPDEYQGRLVTLRGHVQHIVGYPATENRYGIDTLYELWLYADDSQQNPAVVVCTSLPEGLEPGSRLVDHVSVTGYFFKMYGYRARDTARMAPMILAGRPDWRPPPAPKPFVPQAVLYGAVLLVAAAAGLLLWRTNRRDRQFREQRYRPPEKPPEVDLRDLEP